jgi:Cof subfamily protein (haloacid dehalogenase superfamily)
LNGALVVDREMRVLEERTIEREVVAPVIELLSAHGLAVWAYQGSQWFVSDENGPHIEREARSCDCRPTRLGDFSTLTNGITKVVGVSDDAEASAAASAAMRDEFAQRVTATSSQSFFLDVTHPDANKGRVVRFLAAHYGVATDEIMTIGDMHNDVSMFAESGLSVAMGNANDTVRAAASTVTRSNDDEGFAYAIEHFVLGA